MFGMNCLAEQKWLFYSSLTVTWKGLLPSNNEVSMKWKTEKAVA